MSGGMSRATPASAQMADAGDRKQPSSSFPVEDSPATKRVRHAYRTDLRETKELLNNELLTEEDAADDRSRARKRYHEALDARSSVRWQATVEGRVGTGSRSSSSSGGEEQQGKKRRQGKYSSASKSKKKATAKKLAAPKTVAETRQCFQDYINASTSVCWYKECVDASMECDGEDEDIGRWAARDETFPNVIPAEKCADDKELTVWRITDGYAVCSICLDGGNRRHEKIDIEVS